MITMAELTARAERSAGGCLEWTGATSKAGYGQVRRQGKLLYAHRLAWELSRGPIPDGQHVCHRCDNPRCFAIEHLFLGSHLENMKDMVAKGRNGFERRGERSGKAKLTEAEVQRAKARRKAGEALKDIAADLGVHPAHLSRICSGKRWSHA